MSRKNRIEKILQLELTPAFLNIEDESKNHHVPQGKETHFKITAISSHFNDMTRIARHRLLNQLLGEEFNSGLHALSMHLYTPEEWEKNNKAVLKSPDCHDGYAH